jgi:hypothetical protein
MNALTGKLTLVAIVVISGLFSSEQSTSAHGNCREVEGKWIDVYPGTGNVSTGTITDAGILKGTTETVYNSAGFPTPDPTTVSFTADFTITTGHGQLKTRNVYLYDFGTGLFTVLGRIDPDTSTGRFAGATGVLFPSGKTTGNGFTYQAEIAGEICLADK